MWGSQQENGRGLSEGSDAGMRGSREGNVLPGNCVMRTWLGSSPGLEMKSR